MKTLLQKVFGKRKNTDSISSKVCSCIKGRRLQIESLEERQMLAISAADFNSLKVTYPDLNLTAMADYNVIEITASQLSDATLRNAINTAATTTKNDLIVVRTTATQNKITLSGTELGINIDTTQKGSVTIVSLGTEKLTIDADQKSRVFNIGSTSTVALADLTITGGQVGSYSSDVYGGGIYSDGTLMVTNCRISGNAAYSSSGASSYGGGIHSSGTLTVTNSTVLGNQAHTGYANNFTSSRGGGIYASGMLTITNSTIMENQASTSNYTSTSSEGGGVYASGTVTITNSTIAGNEASSSIYRYGGPSASSKGGGIYVSGTVTITNSTITGNQASSIIEFYAPATSYSYGGGIYSESGTLTLTDSTITGNRVSSFIFTSYYPILTSYGGGIYSTAASTLINCTISKNNASDGGGIYSTAASTLTNCTISGNTAEGVYGGGIYTSHYLLTLYNTIVVENIALIGVDICCDFTHATGFNNLTTYDDWNNVNPGTNFLYGSNLPLFFDATNGNYQLAPDSQAIDVGNNQYAYDAGLDKNSKDMAGNPRFSGTAIDIGAYEFFGSRPTPTFGKTEIGKLTEENEFTDYRSFAIDAGTIVSFDLLQGDFAGMTLKLVGPGFSQVLTEVSGELTLANAGTYYLVISSDKEMSYAFRMEQRSAEDVSLDTVFNGKITGSRYAKIFEITTELPGSLQFILNDPSGVNRNEIYVQYGEAPTRTQYDWKTTATGSSQILTADYAPAGTYYILVYSDYAPKPTDYTLTVNQSWFRLLDVTQDVLLEATTPENDLVLTIEGFWLEDITKITLIDAQGKGYDAQNVALLSYLKLNATFDKSKIPAGTYTVRATGKSGATVQKEKAFTKYAVEQAVWESRITAPSALNSSLITSILVEYSNTGNVPMVAPIVVVAATQNGNEGAFLTSSIDALNTFYKNRQYNELPEGFGHEIEFLANGAVPGMIMPGETIRTTIYYAGWLADGSWDDFSRTTFTVSSYQPDETTEVDWVSELFDVLTDEDMAAMSGYLDMTGETLGHTWGEYVVNLNNVSSRMSEYYGDRIIDIPTLQGYLLDEAYDKWQESLVPQTASMAMAASVPGNVGIQATAAPLDKDALDKPGTVYVFKGGNWVVAKASEIKQGLRVENFVLIHGWNASINDPEWLAMAQALQDKNPDANVLGVDWSHWAIMNVLGTGWFEKNIFNPWGPAGDIPEVAERATYQLFAPTSYPSKNFGCVRMPVELTPSGIKPVYRNESASFQGLGLNPGLTHIIGHSHGAHIAGLIGEDAAEYSLVAVSRITVLDASAEISHLLGGSNLWGQGWDKKSATFIDSYKSSNAGGNTPWGDNNFVLLEKNQSWAPIWNIPKVADAHGFAIDWFISTIKYGKTDSPGYYWNSTSWDMVRKNVSLKRYASYAPFLALIVSDLSGNWKFEALSVALDPGKFNVSEKYDLKDWKYPGTWSQVYVDKFIPPPLSLKGIPKTVSTLILKYFNIDNILNDLKKSYELTYKFSNQNMVVTPGKTYTASIDVQDNSQIDSVSGRQYGEFNEISQFTFENTRLFDESAKRFLNVTFLRSTAAYSGHLLPQFKVPSYNELQAAFGTPKGENGEYYYDLTLETTPVNKNIHELYQANDKVSTTIRIMISGIWADAGNDVTYTISPSSTASTTLYGRGGINQVDNVLFGLLGEAVKTNPIYGYRWEDKNGRVLADIFGSTPITNVPSLTINGLGKGTHTYTLTVYGATKSITATDTMTVTVKVKKDPLPPKRDNDDDSPQNRSCDPNELLGPVGYGEKGYIALDKSLAYQINFENDAQATAPAQRVDVEIYLDKNLDWSTFEFSGFGFAGIFVPLVNDTYSFDQVVAMNIVPLGGTEEVSILVDVCGGIDMLTGRVYASFQTVDPESEWGLPPFDVNIGFLFPTLLNENKTAVDLRGMGYISYMIKPKSNLKTDDSFNAVAKIQFDFGEIIYTNQIDPHDPSKGTDPAKECWLTIDNTAPTSHVLPLDETSKTNRYVVNWTGSDVGSGVAYYDVYVSVNGGAFEIWQKRTSETSAYFEGENGKTYSFISVATDNVGLTEAMRDVADATITVHVGPTGEKITQTISMPSTGTANKWTVRRDGNNLQIVDAANKVVFTQLLAGFNNLVVNSGNAGNDELIVDFSYGGGFDLVYGLVFNGSATKTEAITFKGSDGDDILQINIDVNDRFYNGLPIFINNVEQFTIDGKDGYDQVWMDGSNDNDTFTFTRGITEFSTTATKFNTVNIEEVFVNAQGGNNDKATVNSTDSDNAFSMADNFFVLLGGGYRLELRNFNSVDAFASGRKDKTYVYGEKNSLIIMNDHFVERRAQDQNYRIWNSEQVIAINMDDTNNAILHTGSSGYDTYTLAPGYGTATNAAGSYYHEFIDFKNVSISTPMSKPTVSLSTATGWTQQTDRGVWTQNGFTVTVMGNANVVTRDKSVLPMQAAVPLVETLALETSNPNDPVTPTETVQGLTGAIQALSSPITQPIETPLAATSEQIPTMALAPTAFEMTLPLEENLQTGVILNSDDAPSTAKFDSPFANDHFDHARWDDNLFAFLADEQVRLHRKNDNWHGQNDGYDWLAEFEKLPLLELRK